MTKLKMKTSINFKSAGISGTPLEYYTPEATILELYVEGVLCASGNSESVEDDYGTWN